MKHIFLIFFGSLLVFVSCKKEEKKAIEKPTETSIIKYAKGFDIIDNKGIKKLIINHFDTKSEYQILPKHSETEQIIDYDHNTIFIDVPVEKMVATSTTHIPMIELLNEENSLIGFPHTKYISSEKQGLW